MNKKAITGIFILGSLFLGSQAFSFSKQNDKNGYFSRFINRFDADKNGEVSKMEFETGMQQRFEKMDLDNNGEVSKEEFKQQAKAKRRAIKSKFKSDVVTDNEGRISKQAYLDAKLKKAERKFARLDKDGDGFLSQQERMAAKAARRMKKARHYFKKIDANGDGVISVEENRASAARMFNKLDKNGDQVITQDEIQAMKKQRDKSSTS